MPEPSRMDLPPRNPQYPQGSERGNFSSEHGPYLPLYEKESRRPPSDTYGRLPEGRAESLGRSVGFAIGSVLRFPQQLGEVNSRVRHAGSMRRARASAAALEMMDTAAERAEHLWRRTSDIVSDLTRSTRFKAAQLEDQAAARWDELRSSARSRLDMAERRAAAQWNDTRQAATRLQQEEPGRFLMIVAGTAFVIGVGVRIWRSSHYE